MNQSNENSYTFSLYAYDKSSLKELKFNKMKGILLNGVKYERK